MIARAITWWSGRPCDFKYALAGMLAPHVLLSVLILARHYFP